MKSSKLLLCFLLLSGAAARAQDTTYTWTGGAPGFSGTIVLDSPASSHGSVSDIVSIMVNTPSFGPLSMNMSTVSLGDPAFTWNSSQITFMFLGGLAANDPFDNIFVEETPHENDLTVRTILYDYPFDVDTSGSWKAQNVPDAVSSFWLLGMTVAGMAGVRRCFNLTGKR